MKPSWGQGRTFQGVSKRQSAWRGLSRGQRGGHRGGREGAARGRHEGPGAGQGWGHGGSWEQASPFPSVPDASWRCRMDLEQGGGHWWSALRLRRSSGAGVWPPADTGAGSSPDHGKEDGTTANEVHQEKDLPPEPVVTGTLSTDLNNEVDHVGQNLRGGVGGRERPMCTGAPHTCIRAPTPGPQTHLQRDYDPKDVLLVRQHVLEGQVRADQGDAEEEEGDLQPGGGGRAW